MCLSKLTHSTSTGCIPWRFRYFNRGYKMLKMVDGKLYPMHRKMSGADIGWKDYGSEIKLGKTYESTTGTIDAGNFVYPAGFHIWKGKKNVKEVIGICDEECQTGYVAVEVEYDNVVAVGKDSGSKTVIARTITYKRILTEDDK